ncbi:MULTISPECIES: TIGR03826 family flagellar region protein [Paenibacillus]|jgi:flagellar operon protein (TIGR03826 family)|uniref:Flagellar protein n=2 Tax=Paenibacillus TaxID=44249 RepID=A0AAJ3J0T2_PAEPO|nr:MULTISPECIES: TIGR03826 family flagellar region protein [Paenibacillus]AIW41961.1 flagellar protein [Paenibacillus polymyxa CR1]ALA44210.1 flagellar protein [Paenibacillus peoriae]APB73988.1 flagellar protein [Paenibacillus polymyxa]APQ61506.1 flagellar protein [Paenibacillus polymyxa]MBP1173381.1 flagellar operon protein (TIGR03826 family) [Paenibacillus sp. PvR133]
MNLDNCPRCGKLFIKNVRGICQNCIKEIEFEYERCVKHIRENKGIHMHELSEATEVSVKQITTFIREGRISIANAPNMTYPCEVCGIPIREGHMCDSCRTRLTKDLHQAVRESSNQDQSNNMGSGTYSAIDKLRGK